MRRNTALGSRSALVGLTTTLLTAAPVATAQAGPYEDMVFVVNERNARAQGRAIMRAQEIAIAESLGLLDPGIRPPKIFGFTLLSSIVPTTGDHLSIINFQAEDIEQTPWAEVEAGIVPGLVEMLAVERGNSVGVRFDGSVQSVLLDPFTGAEGPVVPSTGGSQPDPDDISPVTTISVNRGSFCVDGHWTIDGERVSWKSCIPLDVVSDLFAPIEPPPIEPFPLEPFPLDPLAEEFDDLRVQSEIAFETAVGASAYDVAGMTSGQRDGDATLSVAAAEELAGLDPEALMLGADLGVVFVGGLGDAPEALIPAGFYRIGLSSEDGETLLASWYPLGSNEPVLTDIGHVLTQPGPHLGGVIPVVSFDDGSITAGATWSPAGSETQVTVSVTLTPGMLGPL